MPAPAPAAGDEEGSRARVPTLSRAGMLTLISAAADHLVTRSPCHLVICMWHSRTFWRLFGTFSVLLLCSIVLLGAIMVSRFERLLLRQIEESLRTKAILIRDVVRAIPGGSEA